MAVRGERETVSSKTGQVIGRFAGVFNRSKIRRENHLGIIPANQSYGGALGKVRLYRRDILDTYDAYYEGRQYNHLLAWDKCDNPDSPEYIPVRKRQPRIKYAFAKVMAQRITAKLLGGNNFPSFKSPDLEYQEFQMILGRVSQLQVRLLEPIRRMCISGAVLVRFWLEQGTIKIEHYLAKQCYPEFDPTGALEYVVVKYVYTDHNDIDDKGEPRRKWFMMELGQQSDVLYDNPEYQENVEPEFNEVARADHGFGFVQAEWFRTSENKDSEDGYSLIEDILPIIDEINYSLSQSSQAVGYNQDPQLVLKRMTDDELEGLIRSSTKAWNLGREGSAEFVESNLGAVEKAEMLRTQLRLHLQDITRIILMDPEKMLAHATSGKALEILHGPMIELINEMRPVVEERVISMQTKLAVMTLRASSMGQPAPVTSPPGWVPATTELTIQWSPVFQQTLEEQLKRVQIATQLTAASIFSREWAARWLAADFGVEDIELELQKVAAQPIINPFSAF